MFERYAIFYTATGALARFGGAYLGWDSAGGTMVPHPEIPGVDVAGVTAVPRKYGFHGTLKAPFRMRAGRDPEQLKNALADFAGQHSAFEIGTMGLRHDHGFVALRPSSPSRDLQDLAAEVVRFFDDFRADLNAAEIARRRQVHLTQEQDQQMLAWGYPFIFNDFHFHLTLSGRLETAPAMQLMTALEPHLAKLVPDPFKIDAVTLMGEDKDGMFHQLHRAVLMG